MSKELYTGELYWPMTLPDYSSYPPLRMNKRVRVAIIGGGMSGTLCGYRLAREGISTVLLERGEVAGGSSSANTGLLQFSNDMMLTEMIDRIGENEAHTFYAACREAVEDLARVAEELGCDVGFSRRSSLYYASHEEDVPRLRREYEALFHAGFDVEYLEEEQIERLFPFRKHGAIVTHGDAELNPFRFVHALAEAGSVSGLRIHEDTDVIGHEQLPNGRHKLRTSDGYWVEAEHVIYAIGYEPEELRGQLIGANLNRSFAMVTEPVSEDELAHWHKRWLIWETARPYLYMRTTPDNRIIIGGLDESCPQPVQDEALLREHTERLYAKLQAHIPGITAPVTAQWSATFGESRDGLPFIGRDPKYASVYYCLGYGGNGTVYSMMASSLLLEMINGKADSPLAEIVRLDRETMVEQLA
ncbi:glycine/D-amino acid oxidase-like deaminating enzyme [Paenibacillus phyllosphaerae]|uniref:Glycine/D-amino acid oxidase-like deaminating enzyme n=1 Tax=Paenibacillus phyllosphaerae TaxID=274593 RepID=A0A7W5ATT0_9BACL|nr:FAD-dependent oxidoreductase [Paenibacillus phyllosphaerae]MBB3108532.1 glycine/D-amino acid oxidase-like deaminating enzyme [Paenibacillus phyllosphaerae]